MATWSMAISTKRVGEDLLGILTTRLSAREGKRVHRLSEEQLLGDERLTASPSQLVERRIMQRCTSASLSSLRSTTPYKGRSFG